MTASSMYERDMRYDLRRHEAQAIAHAIFAEIRDLIPHEVEGDVHDRLLSTLHRNGVLLVRENERGKLGLEQCDEKGWTPSERAKYEQDRLNAMYSMASFIVPNLDGGDA